MVTIRPRRSAVAACLALLLVPAPLQAQGRIPAECWLDQADNQINSCKYCHTSGQPGAGNNDIDRQGTFPVQENLFLNVLDPGRLDDLVPPATLPTDLSVFLRLDNYRLALEARGGDATVGSGAGVYKYFPDLDPGQTGADGFANNGWRAFKWKPFELAWPRHNGRIQQNWIRLPDRFQRDAAGELDRATYAANLDLLVEVLRGAVPSGSYLGLAADEAVDPFRFPVGSEVLHYLYYLDPAAPDMRARRIKEVRWNIKSASRDDEQFDVLGYVSRREREVSLALQEDEAAAEYGLVYNGDAWDIIGFIEREDGTLRPQSEQEMVQCLGCHSRRTGLPVDSHFQSLQRKLPGEDGWRRQDYADIQDFYNAGLARGEYEEIHENYFGDEARVPRRPEGSVDFLPPPDLADALTRRYLQIVQSQSFVLGRDPKLANNGILRAPSTARFLPKEQQEAWQPALDFTRFDVVLPTAVLATDGGVRPRWTRLDANYPNPFNAATVLRFSLARAADVELAVRALDGHLVRRLHAGPLAAGAHSITWDGRDAEGRAAASGVYLAELRSAAGRQAMKMLLLR